MKNENKIKKPFPVTILPPIQHLLDCTEALKDLTSHIQFLFEKNIFTKQNFDHCMKSSFLIESKLNQWILAFQIFLLDCPGFCNTEQMSILLNLLHTIMNTLNLLTWNLEIMRLKTNIRNNSLHQLHFIPRNSRAHRDIKPESNLQQNFGFHG